MHTKTYELNFQYQIPEGMEVPDFNDILHMMFKELVKVYPYYKDTWQHTRLTNKAGQQLQAKDYFIERMREFLANIETAKTDAETIKNYVHLLNLASMGLERRLRN